MAKENNKNSRKNSGRNDKKEVRNNRKKDNRNVTKAMDEKKNSRNYKKKEEKIIDVEEIIDEELDLEEEIDEDLEELNDIEDDEIIEEEKEIEEEDDDDNFDEEDELEDEDLDFDEDEDLEEEVVIKEVKSDKRKDKKKEEKKNIEHVEKVAKEKKKKVRNGNSKLSSVLMFLDKYRYPIYAFIAGVLISVFVAMLIWPDRIATLKNGTQPIVKIGGKTYTADNLYEKMKDYYSVSLLLDQIDNDLLTKIYPEDDAMTKKIQENAEYYLNMYKQYYNYTQEQFLEKNGFSSYEAFLDYLRLDYRRNKYLDDYVEKNLSDGEIQKYYDEKVFGDINTQHVLVEVKSGDDDKSDKLSDEDAKKLAEEIITKLNDGTSWETIQKDYKDKITFEDLSYQSWDASLEESFMTALKEMEDNSYSKEPVKTSYGYHVIYRIDQKKKPSLKKSKDKIVEKIVSEKKAADSNLLYKALISLRNDKKIKFSDTVMKNKYDSYCKQYK